MMDKFLTDQQDPKAVEKVYTRLVDLLTSGEEIIYIATQKKPLVNLLPDCVALTNKRVLFFTPANLGLSIKFIDFVWKDVFDVHIKEEIIGAVFTIKTVNQAEMGVDYLPKVQARKLYQYAQERKEEEREARRQRDLEEKRAESGSFNFEPAQGAETSAVVPASVSSPALAAEPPQKDELTEKLKKLRTLFDQGLISQDEYNAKKLELLSDL
ncbi:MAG TPA: PH domain-containing protein [Mucilaginibacter sp.]|nr:PH domain-containing protein [Mucilaginibacter sp.]